MKQSTALVITIFGGNEFSELGRCSSYELGRHSRPTEKPEGMTSRYYKGNYYNGNSFINVLLLGMVVIMS
jgi:hypothetical protein